MVNYLKMPKRQQVEALLALGWTFRRIERETGVRRETISSYAKRLRSNPAKVFPGYAAESSDEGSVGEGDSDRRPPHDEANPAKVTAGPGPDPAMVTAGSTIRAVAAVFHHEIAVKAAKGLTAQRIYQDLVEEYGYGHSYESVKRYVRRIEPQRRATGVMYCAPGEEGQVDFFQGAPTLNPSGEWRRPWVFRLTLGHSRHGYEEAAWGQKLATFLALHENAFRDLGGVPEIIRLDNLKSGVTRACLYDPDVNAVYAAFAKHWNFTPLPIRPKNPGENGKQERSGGYVKDNALKGRRFDSLAEQNAFLRHWNRTIARLRIHGTTRKQVIAHFEDVEKGALRPLASEPFPFFVRGTRSVHPDGHVEVDGAFYPVPAHLVGREVEVRHDQRLIRVFLDETAVAVHARVRPGHYARRVGEQGVTSSQQAFLNRLLGKCQAVSTDLHAWAQAAYQEREVRALRLIQGVLGLLRSHPKESVAHACRTALANRLFRYQDLRRLTEMADARQPQRQLIDVDDHIRPMTDYALEDFS